MTKNQSRPEWDDYFLQIAALASQRSTCLRRKVGAVLVKEKRILATGYNGAPMRLPHCSETGCLRKQTAVPSGQRHELCRGLHAEQNVLLQAAYHGVSVKGSTLYITNSPCSICAKMIINAGIIKIVYKDNYPDQMAQQFLEKAQIEIKSIEK
jgi:dCMP deaminase